MNIYIFFRKWLKIKKRRKGKKRNVLTLHSWEVNKKVRASLSVAKQDDQYSVKGEGMCRIVVRTVNTRCINRGSDSGIA